MDDDAASTGRVRTFRAVPRLFIVSAALVGMLVADGVLFWVFLVILTAAVVAHYPSPPRRGQWRPTIRRLGLLTSPRG